MSALRLVFPTLGNSPWTAAAVASWSALTECETIAVCPASAQVRIGPAVASARVLEETGRGLYAALNQGFRAPGAWSVGTWLNDDDTLRAAGIARARAALEGDAALAGVFGRVALVDRHDRFLAEIPVARRGDDLGPLVAAGVVPFAQPGTLFRREWFERVGGLDESLQLAADLDFFVRVAEAGGRFAFVDAWVARFRVHGGQLSKQRERSAAETAAIGRRASARAAWAAGATAARARFRRGNWRAYLGRIVRHGWTSMESLYDRE